MSDHKRVSFMHVLHTHSDASKYWRARSQEHAVSVEAFYHEWRKFAKVKHRGEHLKNPHTAQHGIFKEATVGNVAKAKAKAIQTSEPTNHKPAASVLAKNQRT